MAKRECLRCVCQAGWVTALFKFPPSAVLIFIAIYLPFESYFLFISGVGDTLAMLMKLGSELLLYAVFALALFSRLSESRFKRSPIDFSVLMLVMVALLATYIYSASLGAAINNLRALLRYLIVFYLVYHFGFSLASWNRFSKLIVAVISLNVFISVAQFGLGDSYPSMLKVGQKIRVSVGESTEVRHIEKEEKIGAVQGLQEAPGVFGAFLVASISIMLVSIHSAPTNKRRFLKSLLFLTVLAAFLTYSKSGFLLAVLTIVFYMYHYNIRLRRLILIGAFSFSVLAATTFVIVSTSVQQSFAMKEHVTAAENLMNLFSAQYWNHFFAAERGWVIKEVGTQILISLPVVGYSPDPDTARKMIAESSGGGLSKLVGYVAFEDVYWVALFGYFGFLGMFFLLTIFFSLYRKATALLSYARRQGEQGMLAFVSGFLALLFIIAPYCFFERVLEINVFSFYFWLMAGIVVRLHHEHVGQKNTIPEYRRCS